MERFSLIFFFDGAYENYSLFSFYLYDRLIPKTSFFINVFIFIKSVVFSLIKHIYFSLCAEIGKFNARMTLFKGEFISPITKTLLLLAIVDFAEY